MPSRKRMGKTERKMQYIQSLRSALECLLPRVQDQALRAAIEKLIDQVQYSDPMSHESLHKLEQRIKEDAEALGEDVAGGRNERALDCAAIISKQLQERNIKCRDLKN